MSDKEKNMFALKNRDYVIDKQGNKKSVVLKVTDFTRMREDMEDLEDALELEKARKDSTGFKTRKEFIKEIDVKKA
jgi:hypothetical protein